MGKSTIEVPTTERVDIGICDSCGKNTDDGAAYYPVPLGAILDDDTDAAFHLDNDAHIILCTECTKVGEPPVRDISLKRYDPVEAEASEWLEFMATAVLVIALGGALFVVLFLVVP